VIVAPGRQDCPRCQDEGRQGTAPAGGDDLRCRAVLAQKDVDQKTNEITQVKPLLDDVDITGALVTADALHVQKENRQVHRGG